MLRRLASPGPARAGLELVAADALQAPFADGSFDTVVTPWFIDIVGEPFARVAARVNLLLKPGGRWINSGSLAFSRAAHADRIGLDEALELLPGAGFADVRVRENTLPYMRSPASRHSRLENVVTWVTNKVAAPAEAPRARVLPVWLLEPDRPVPRTRAFEMQAISSRIHAFLLALINGERSMRDMARMLVEQRLMSADEAEVAGAAVSHPPARRQREGIMGTFLFLGNRDVPISICHDPPLNRPCAARAQSRSAVEMNLESKTALGRLTTGEGTWAPGLRNFANPR